MVEWLDDAGAIWIADAHGRAAEDLDAVADVLIAEFAGQLHDAIVIEHVAFACQQLLSAGLMAGLGPASESLARARLQAVSSRGGLE